MPSPSDQDPVQEHLRAVVHARVFGTSAAPLEIGRYLVLKPIGSGGLGIVYAAYDPELDRQVALKLMRPEPLGSHGSTAQARLMREAQAMAKLSHPNVIHVYEVGTVGERVFMAMELVHGDTLRTWVETRPRNWRDILRVFVQAGAALVSAHSAGVVHRDFKPDNVLVDGTDRVFVVDFGLATSVALTDPENTLEETGRNDAETSSLDVTALTKTGVMVGTPAYMAPEQFAGDPVTAAADQFSFCVALWEALHGQRPFAGTTLEELKQNVMRARLQRAATGPGVPVWLRRVCQRGLETEPGRRHASMEALVAALEQGRGRARTRRVLGAAVLCAGTAAAAFMLQKFDEVRRVNACDAEGQAISEIWNESAREHVRDAFLGLGLSYAATSVDKTVPWLDRYASEWRITRTDICLDATVRRTWDDQMHERARWCLDERKTQLRSLIDDFSAADAQVVQRSVTAAAGLPPVTVCRDEDLLRRLPTPPTNSVEQLFEIRSRLAAAQNLQATGSYDAALEATQAALADATAQGWPPLIAAGKRQLGSLLVKVGHAAEAETVLEEAFFEASTAGAFDVQVDAATLLAMTVGANLGRPAEGLRWVKHGQSALEKLGESDLPRAAMLHGALGLVQGEAGAYADAETELSRALELQEKTLGSNHPDVARTLNNLAIATGRLGRGGDSGRLFERVLALDEETLGVEHPDVAATLNNLGMHYQDEGRLEEARAAHERALAIKEKALGPDHPKVAQSMNNLAKVLEGMGELDAALELCERALVISERALGPDHPDLGWILEVMGYVHETAGNGSAAVDTHARGLALWEKAYGPDHPQVSRALANLARAYFVSHALEDARKSYERSLELDTRLLGPEHPNVALAHAWLATIALAQEKLDDAVLHGELALSIREQNEEADEVAESRFTLARALWSSNGDRERAKTLAERAATFYREAGRTREADEIDSWLSAGTP